MNCVTYYRAGLRELGDASLLEILGRCGTAGLAVPEAAAALCMDAATARGALRRLALSGYVSAPSRDTRQGRPLRYTLLPHGLALLQTRENITLPAQQIPFPIPPMP